MTDFLSALWSAFAWLPAWARVVLCVIGWFGVCEGIALVLSVGTRFDREVDRNAHHRQMDALAMGSRLRSGSGTVGH